MARNISEIAFTTNEELDNLQSGDNSVDITGAIDRLDPPRKRANAPPSKVALLKAILNNRGPDGGRNIRILAWEEQAKKLATRILGKIIRITRGRVVPVNPLFKNPNDNLMDIEISIGSNAIVEILLEIPQEIFTTPVTDTPLRTIASAEGLIVRVIGYIRHKIDAQQVGNFSYGSGALTDGHFHLCVNIANFDAHLSPEVGTHVEVVGTPKRNRFNTLVLQVQKMDDVKVTGERPMELSAIRQGFRKLPEPNVANGDLPAILPSGNVEVLAATSTVQVVAQVHEVTPLAPLSAAPIAPVSVIDTSTGNGLAMAQRTGLIEHPVPTVSAEITLPAVQLSQEEQVIAGSHKRCASVDVLGAEKERRVRPRHEQGENLEDIILIDADVSDGQKHDESSPPGGA